MLDLGHLRMCSALSWILPSFGSKQVVPVCPPHSRTVRGTSPSTPSKWDEFKLASSLLIRSAPPESHLSCTCIKICHKRASRVWADSVKFELAHPYSCIRKRSFSHPWDVRQETHQRSSLDQSGVALVTLRTGAGLG